MHMCEWNITKTNSYAHVYVTVNKYPCTLDTGTSRMYKTAIDDFVIFGLFSVCLSVSLSLCLSLAHKFSAFCMS